MTAAALEAREEPAAAINDSRRIFELIVGGAVKAFGAVVGREDIDARDDQGRVPLHAAAELGHTEICQLLVWLCADVEARDAGQRTPLLLAAQEGHHAVVQCLLGAPADVNAVDERKCSALHLAVLNGHGSSVRLLLDHGARVDLADAQGDCALHVACRGGSKELVKALVEHGACPSTANESGDTPLDVAVKEGQQAVVDFLTPGGQDRDNEEEEEEEEEEEGAQEAAGEEGGGGRQASITQVPETEDVVEQGGKQSKAKAQAKEATRRGKQSKAKAAKEGGDKEGGGKEAEGGGEAESAGPSQRPPLTPSTAPRRRSREFANLFSSAWDRGNPRSPASTASAHQVPVDVEDMDVPIPCRRQKRNVTQRNLEPPQAQGGPKRNADTETVAQKENKASQPQEQATSASGGGGGARTPDKKKKAQPRKAQPAQGAQAKRAPSTISGRRRGTIQTHKKAMPRDPPTAHNLLRDVAPAEAKGPARDDDEDSIGHITSEDEEAADLQEETEEGAKGEKRGRGEGGAEEEGGGKRGRPVEGGAAEEATDKAFSIADIMQAVEAQKQARRSSVGLPTTPPAT